MEESISWLLHLSDPHLGDPPQNVVLDDDKVQVEGQPDLETSQRVFKRTLRALKWFVDKHGPPTAAVVSGDLTVAAHPSGFSEFIKLLKEREDVFPESRKDIVIVPGNHDVAWDEKPGSEAKYANFLKATREQECATPLIDGVDFGGDPAALSPAALDVPHIVNKGGFLVVPFNSSNYCGVIAGIRGGWTKAEWESALSNLGDEAEAAQKELKKLLQHDMARVSRDQLEALEEYLGKLEIERSASPDGPVRVAVIHHQLLPVSTREERKAFESLINLGLVRQTLREYDFDVVLHGHKHVDALYWDFLSKADQGLTRPPRRMLVVAAPAHFEPGQPVARALALEGMPRARNLRIVTFAGAESHTKKASIYSEERVGLWNNTPPDDYGAGMVINGRLAEDAYARLRALFDLRSGEAMHNLKCEIESPDDALRLPKGYPKVPAENSQTWFEELVAWWQLKRSELVAYDLMPFNHGERIYKRWGDQIERTVRMLEERRDSSRALVALVSPRETGRYEDDSRDLDRGTYPAFSLAEFSLESRNGVEQLDCIAYFRKQEMQYWWPVNIAELRSLQENVAEELKAEVKPGRITTVSAVAHWGQTIPRVAVPEIDRLVEKPASLTEMAMTVAFPEASFPEARRRWRNALAELEGDEDAQPPRPAVGHLRLLNELGQLAKAMPENDALGSVHASLEKLSELYAAHEEDELNQAATKLIREAVGVVQSSVKEALGDQESSSQEGNQAPDGI
jgi:3',5'-cyclic AMP phosphodiesterase CpdA